MPATEKEPKFQEELPPIGKLFTLGYDKGDEAFPIIGIVRDPREGLGQTPPEIGAQCPDPRYPNHTFVELRVTKPDVRVLWVYQILGNLANTPTIAGATISDTKLDPETHGAITLEKQESVVPGTVPTAGGVNVLQSEVKQTSAGQAVLTTKELTDSDGWPVLESQPIDPTSKIVVNESKQVIPTPLSWTGSGSYPYAAGTDTNGAISSISVTNPGSGYITTPNVTIADQSGTGASATAVMAPDPSNIGKLSSIILDQGGSGYANTTGLSVPIAAPTSGTTATASATLAPCTMGTLGTIAWSQVTQQAVPSFTQAPMISFSGGGGTAPTPFLATLVEGGIGIASQTAGSGYTSSDNITVTVTNGSGDTTGAGAVVIANFHPSDGGVTFDLTTAGAGYSSSTYILVTSADGNGSGASVTLHVSSAGALSIASATSGTGYTTAPNLQIIDPGSGTCTATSVLSGSGIASLVWPNATSSNPEGVSTDLFSYFAPPTLSIGTPGSGGTRATVTKGQAILNTTGIGVATLNGKLWAGNKPTLPLSVKLNVSGGGGIGAQLTLHLTSYGSAAPNTNGDYINAYISVDNPGTGYTSLPTSITIPFISEVQITGGGLTSLEQNGTVAATLAPSTINVAATNAALSAGSGYTSNSTVTISRIAKDTVTTPIKDVVTAVISGSGVASIVITSDDYYHPNNGWTAVPAVSFQNAPGDTTGSGATATAVVSSGAITGFTITTAGTGYTAPPTVVLTQSTGSGAAITASLQSGTVVLSVQNAGTGYTAIPSMSVSAPVGDGTAATATANLLPTGIYIPVPSGGLGSGYTSNPSVTITAQGADIGVAGATTPATATATIATTYIQSVQLLTPGSGYDPLNPPSITISGGSGSGAAAHAVPVTLSVIGVTVSDGGTGYVNPSIVIDQPASGVQAAAVTFVVTGFSEIQALDKWRSILIVSKIDPTTLPQPEVWNETIRQNFPTILKDQYFILYVNNNLQGTSYPGGINPMSIPHRADYQDSLSQAVQATVTRSYWLPPPNQGPPILPNEQETQFLTASHDIKIAFDNQVSFYPGSASIASCLHGSLHSRYFVYIRQSFAEPVIYDDLVSAELAAAESIGYSNTDPWKMLVSVIPFDQGPIPATYPDPTNSAQWNPGVTQCVAKVAIEKWRLGVWIKTVYGYTLPTDLAKPVGWA